VLGVCLPDLLFDPEDGGGTFIENVSLLLPDYIASHHSGSSSVLIGLIFMLLSPCFSHCMIVQIILKCMQLLYTSHFGD
jgi:hypothetical protein